ncbi:hypothetical protein [Devosia sp. MC1541]|uniref:DUF7380 domain-containing protein n=1 Tax=Devosia sp. MC1541 TaxID=2725264 RepID=UPI00145D5754|nr:hypothetical protein [Devosia sp. MC1541]
MTSDADSEQSDKTSAEQEAPAAPLRIVPAEDFDLLEFEAPIAGVDEVECHVLESAYRKAFLDAAGVEPQSGVFQLLSQICGLHFKLKDKAETYGAQIVMGSRRSSIPADWKGEQNEALNVVFDKVKHPGLRARIADVVWVNDRTKAPAALEAIEAYCEAAEGLRSGKYKVRFERESDVSIEEVDLVERAIQISTMTAKRGTPLPNRVISAVDALYDAAQAHLDVVPFKRAAGLRFRHSLMDNLSLAKELEQFAHDASKKAEAYPMALKSVWELAESVYDYLKLPDDVRRCQLASVEMTIAMKEQVFQASAKAHWLREAISQLRNIPDTKEYQDQLFTQMRTLQEEALAELSSFSIPMDMGDTINSTIKVFEELGLAEGIKQFAFLTWPSSVENLRAEALETLNEQSIVSMFGATHHDADGKVIAELEAPGIGEQPSEQWIKYKMEELEGYRRFQLVNGYIHPAREFLSSSFPVSERHFYPIVRYSPFVPASHEHIFALGMARFIQGDYVSAVHLLIPQIENSIRHVLKNLNTDSSKILSDMVQEDRSLDALLRNFKAEMDRIFTADNVLQIDLLFNGKPGPGLRHELAHGKFNTGYCYHPNTVYALWFIFQLCVLPILKIWDSHVAPAIEANSF